VVAELKHCQKAHTSLPLVLVQQRPVKFYSAGCPCYWSNCIDDYAFYQFLLSS